MPEAFRLDVAPDGLATLTFDAPGRSVNVFDRETVGELERKIDELGSRSDVGCLVLLSGKSKGFIAGADVEEIAAVSDPTEAEAAARYGQRVFAAWEALPFPTVAAIDGNSMGGGTELALASTYRVVSDRDGYRIGLPEVKLGIVPAWGGCTRLPRLIGLTEALGVILPGGSLSPKKALRTGFADALMPEVGFLRHVRDFAAERIGKTREGSGGPDFKELLLEKNPLGRKIVFDKARKDTLAKTGGKYPAPLRALEVIRVGLEEGRRAGFDAEARALAELAVSPIAKNLVHVFGLGEAAKKRPREGEWLAGGEAREVTHAAVLGAGTMGGGIAQLVAHQTQVPVRMRDIASEALAGGMEHAGGLFDKLVSRRKLTEPEAKRRMALIRPGLDFTGFGSVDFVVEAVVEKLDVKRKVFAEVAEKVRPEAVLASNTSSLPIGEIGSETPRPERVVGMHFFNPVHKMPLVEVIASEATAPWAARTVFDFAKSLGKTPVLVKDTPGFLVNRLLMFYSVEGLFLLEDGYAVEDLDRAMSGWGMPMGPMELNDEVGIDVSVKVAHILVDAFPDRLEVPDWLDRLPESGHLGKKAGKGFYRWKGGEKQGVHEEVYDLLGLGARLEEPDPRVVPDRMVLPMVDEAAVCLEEGVVASPGELDLALIYGTGFPPFRGGLCRFADREGVASIVETLERLADSVAPRFAPSEALRRTAEAGGFYARDWSERGPGRG